MSNLVNTELFERAAEMVTYFEGKLPAKVIEQDLKHNDLEALRYHVADAEAVAAQNELEAADVV